MYDNRDELASCLQNEFKIYRIDGRLFKLMDQVVPLCDNWYNSVDHSGMKPDQMHDNLRAYIMHEVNYRGDNPYKFIPAFVWIWLAGQVISFIISWYLNKKRGV